MLNPDLVFALGQCKRTNVSLLCSYIPVTCFIPVNEFPNSSCPMLASECELGMHDGTRSNLSQLSKRNLAVKHAMCSWRMLKIPLNAKSAI